MDSMLAYVGDRKNSVHLSSEYVDLLTKCNRMVTVKLERGSIQAATSEKFGIVQKAIVGGMGGSGLDVPQAELRETIKELETKIKQRKIPKVAIYDPAELDLEGYEKTVEYTPIVDLSPSENFFWNKLFDKKTRNTIRKAIKSEVKITIGVATDFKKYCALLEETASRGGFLTPSKHFFETAFDVFGANIKLFIAKKGSEILSGAIILSYKDAVFFWSGASSSAGQKYGPNELLHWEIIKWAKAKGYKYYNMWGANINPESSDYAVYRFKKQFGGELVPIYQYSKVFFPLKHSVLKISTEVYKKIKSFANKRLRTFRSGGSN